MDRPAADLEATYRRIKWRLFPLLYACYIFSHLDRVNISFAKLQFMPALGLSEGAYGFAASLFFLGYLLFEVPSNLYLRKAGARRTFTRIMILWGMVSAAMSLIKTPAQLYAARFLLGAAEAGFFPGLILYLTYWFPSGRRARITSLFLSGNAVAGIVGGPLSGWIMKTFDGRAGWQGWQWLFLLEGVPTILLGFLVFAFLDDGPEEVRWLRDAERTAVRDDLAADRQTMDARHHGGLGQAFRDPKVYVASFVYFAILCGVNVITLWTPTLLKASGLTGVGWIGWVSSLPYLGAVAAMYLVGRHSDRTLERRWHVALPLVVAGASFCGLGAAAGHPVAMLLLLVAAAVGVYSAFCIFWTVPPAYLTGRAAAGGIALISSLGGFGGFASPNIVGWAQHAGGGLGRGFLAIGLIVFAGAAALLLGVSPQTLHERKDPALAADRP